MASVPLMAPAGGLDQAKDLDAEENADGVENLVEGTINNDSVGDVSAKDAPKEEEKEDVIDPEDPLYGLEQRLKYADLDDDTKNVIKAKLA